MNKVAMLVIIIIVNFLEITAAVTLTESTVQWKTFKHTVNPDNSLLNDTFSANTVTNTYNSLILENEYLKVTLVPDYGGRILSIVYKPTGHEQLYQNPVGRPYGPQWDAFYYDWLMIWGGIFPTFPEPEHGKAWCRPWAYGITSNTADKVSVKMTYTDTINFKTHPTQFKYGTTNITCNFEVTLAAQTSALKTSVTLINPNSREVPLEYWTNVGIAPGSVPGNTRCNDQTEIIGPVNTVKIADSWTEIQNTEQKVNGTLFRFKNLRWYKNWANDGIAYAWPLEGNFWGAINHANNEAILRISENIKTPGLKIWGFGYNQSRNINPETNNDYHRPFIELWAGISKEFFTPAQLPAKSTLQFDEYYTPAVGLSSFTHASEHAVLSLSTDKTSYNGITDKNVIATCRYFLTKPASQKTLSLRFKGTGNTVPVYEVTKAHDTNGPFEIKDTIAVQDLCNDINRLVFEINSDSKTLMSAEIPVSFSNAGTCATIVKQYRPGQKFIEAGTDEHVYRKLYTINGIYVDETRSSQLIARHQVFLSVDKQGRCTRFIKFGH